MKITGYYRHIICVTCISLFLLSGCKSSQKVTTVDAGAAKAHAVFFDSMMKQAFQFETISARMQVELNMSGKEMSSRVDLKMIRDSAFVLSIQPVFGMELFRMEMNRDSVKVIDRMNRRYVAENHQNLRGQTPIVFNFNNLQALFVNHLFSPGEDRVTPDLYNRFRLIQEGRTAEIQAKDRMGLNYIFTADGEEKLLSTYISNASEDFALQWAYKDFRLAEGQPFPMLMDVTLFSDGVAEGGIKMHFNRIQTNVPVRVESSVPEKYQRITLADLFKSFRK